MQLSSSLLFVLILLSLGNNSGTDIWDDPNIDDSGTYFDNDGGNSSQKFEEDSYEGYNNDDKMEV